MTGPEHTAEKDACEVPVPISAYGDDLYDECDRCGLATTSDGKRHGNDLDNPW